MTSLKAVSSSSSSSSSFSSRSISSVALESSQNSPPQEAQKHLSFKSLISAQRGKGYSSHDLYCVRQAWRGGGQEKGHKKRQWSELQRDLSRVYNQTTQQLSSLEDLQVLLADALCLRELSDPSGLSSLPGLKELRKLHIRERASVLQEEHKICGDDLFAESEKEAALRRIENRKREVDDRWGHYELIYSTLCLASDSFKVNTNLFEALIQQCKHSIHFLEEKQIGWNGSLKHWKDMKALQSNIVKSVLGDSSAEEWCKYNACCFGTPQETSKNAIEALRQPLNNTVKDLQKPKKIQEKLHELSLRDFCSKASANLWPDLLRPYLGIADEAKRSIADATRQSIQGLEEVSDEQCYEHQMARFFMALRDSENVNLFKAFKKDFLGEEKSK